MKQLEFLYVRYCSALYGSESSEDKYKQLKELELRLEQVNFRSSSKSSMLWYIWHKLKNDVDYELGKFKNDMF